MTKTNRIISFIQGSVLMLFAVLLVFSPAEKLTMVTGLVGLGLSLRGIRALVYYFRMAKYMVGGKYILYQGIIYLDLGVFIYSLANDRAVYIIFYIAVVNAFAGVIDVLRAGESKKIGSRQWIISAIHGAVSVALAAAVIISALMLHRLIVPVYVYAAGLAYSALQRIIRAFRRTAVAYIP